MSGKDNAALVDDSLRTTHLAVCCDRTTYFWG